MFCMLLTNVTWSQDLYVGSGAAITTLPGSVLFAGSNASVNSVASITTTSDATTSGSSFIGLADTLSPWTRSGHLSLGGTFNFVFGKSLKKSNLNIIENTTYKIEYHKNKMNQIHSFHHTLSISKHGKDQFQIDNDNLLYAYRLEIDHTKKYHFGFLLDLRTQSAPGTSTGSIDDKLRISNFFSPAIITEGVTYGYNNDKGMHVTYSPLSGKHTLVLDKNVDPTYYGLDEGKRVQHEMGTFLALGIHGLQIIKNFTLSSEVLFFSNYLKDVGAIDFSSNNTINIDLNKWISLKYILVMNYDNDHNVPVSQDLVTNYSGTTLVYTQSKVKFSNILFLSFNINYNLKKKK